MAEDTCELCGKETNTESTSMVGNYCIDCHRLTISESRKAIEKLKGMVRKYNKPLTSKDKKEAYDKALNNLLSPSGVQQGEHK